MQQQKHYKKLSYPEHIVEQGLTSDRRKTLWSYRRRVLWVKWPNLTNSVKALKEVVGSHLTQCGLGRGLSPCRVLSWSIQPLATIHQRYRPDRQDRQTDRTTVR